MGVEAKLKAGVAGDKEGKPPAGCSGGKVNRLRKGQAPTGCGITLPCPTKKEKIHCRRKIARTPCALPPNMLY